MVKRGKLRAGAPAGDEFDVLASGLVSGLPRDLLRGENLDLLSPLRFLAPGKLPTGRPPRSDRSALARSLAMANLSYGHPRSAALADKLADPETRVVVSGQQTGLFGGPLLALVKAAAAVRWAEALEAKGKPAVALFWMATEDHDWNEVARASFPTHDGLRAFPLGDDPQPLAPIGLRTVGVGVLSILRELAELFPGADYRAWLGRLMAIWRPEARFGEAFARQIVATFGERAPLLVDSLAPALKRAEAPYLRQLVERRETVSRLSSAAEARIVARGHALRVAPQPGASPLFLLRAHERRRIEWSESDQFRLRGLDGEEPIADLLETLADNPSIVSPGVLARPAIQDAVLGTTLQVVGPGELAYMAQAAPIYEVLEIAAPWTTLRPQAVVLDAKQRRWAAELDLRPAELLADRTAAEQKLGNRSSGGFVGEGRRQIEALVDALRDAALAIDPNLEKPHSKTRESVLHALDTFAAKVAAAAARKDEVVRQRFSGLAEALCPDGGAQERVVSAAHFPGRFGPSFGGMLLDQLDLDPRRLTVIEPEPVLEPAPPPPPEVVAEGAPESAPPESSEPAF